MEYRNLGRTGLQVSELCLGTMQWGWTASEEEGWTVMDAFMEAGGDITQIGTLDQTRFSHLEDYDTLKGRNAQQVFQEMEWE